MSEQRTWIKAAREGEIGDEDAIVIEHEDAKIAVFFVQGEYFATSNLCTHEIANLSEGYIDGLTIECPLHQGVFCLRTGRALAAPAEKPINTYPVKVEGGQVFVCI